MLENTYYHIMDELLYASSSDEEIPKVSKVKKITKKTDINVTDKITKKIRNKIDNKIPDKVTKKVTNKVDNNIVNKINSESEKKFSNKSKQKKNTDKIPQVKVEDINEVDGIYVPWTEKYRPQILDDLVADESIKMKINKIIHDKNMPNIIVTGIPGVGKTSTIQCIALNILGKYMSEGLLESNASDDRGIKAVQECITFFCKKKVDFIDDTNRYAKHKIILLDEADNMTEKAQRLINELMENHKTTRFAFTCNTSSKIIESIQSKCIILRYKRLLPQQIEQRLKYIADRESVKYTREGMSTLIAISQGDLRQAISSLQVMSINCDELNQANVYKIYDKPELLLIGNIFQHTIEKNFVPALKILTDLKNKGYSSADITFSMLLILKSPGFITIDEGLRVYYAKKISKTYFQICQGIDTTLQLTGCIAKLCL